MIWRRSTLTSESKAESWDGTSWTEVGDLNTAEMMLEQEQTSMLLYLLEEILHQLRAIQKDWNGAAWSEVADLSTARRTLAGSDTSITSAVAFGGKTATAITAATEEWSGSSVTTKVLTD